MIIETSKQQYIVRFYYGERDEKDVPTLTRCYISLPREEGAEKGVVIGTGEARRHSNDQHMKRIARKISLEKAIAQLKLDKDERKEFWDSYRNRGSVTA